MCTSSVLLCVRCNKQRISYNQSGISVHFGGTTRSHRAGYSAVYRCESYARNGDSHRAKRETCTFFCFREHGCRLRKANAKECHIQNRIDDEVHNLGCINDTLGKRLFSAPRSAIQIHTHYRRKKSANRKEAGFRDRLSRRTWKSNPSAGHTAPYSWIS